MPLLWLSLAFLSGIALADYVAWPVWVWVSLSVGTFLLWGISRLLSHFPRISRVFTLWAQVRLFNQFIETLRKIPIPALLILSSVFAGAARFQAVQPKITTGSVAWYNDRDEIDLLEGVIVDPPDERDSYTNLRVAADLLQPAQNGQNLNVRGLVLAMVLPGEDWHYGDRVRLAGKLETPPEEEGFSYRDYLARQGVYTLIRPTQISLLGADQGNPLRSALYALKKRLLERESANPNPRSPYAVSKLAAEFYVRTIGDLWGIETVSLRVFNAYGPGQHLPPSHPPVIMNLLRQATRGGTIVVHGDGSQTRDYVYIDDVVSAMIAAATAPGLDNLVINIGSGKETSVKELAHIILELTHSRVEVINNPRTDPGVSRMCADLSLAREKLGYQSSISLPDGLRLTLEKDTRFRQEPLTRPLRPKTGS